LAKNIAKAQSTKKRQQAKGEGIQWLDFLKSSKDNLLSDLFISVEGKV